jgi:hypothetical protein
MLEIKGIHYIGSGEEINCPNCGTEIEYNPKDWVYENGVYKVKGHCPNNGCDAYSCLRVRGAPSPIEPLRFRTERLATEDEIAIIKPELERLKPFMGSNIII